MKKYYKKICGTFGLAAVIITTIFAASIPTDSAQAANNTSITDTIQVRVVGDSPSIEYTDETLIPVNEVIQTQTNRKIAFQYYNAVYLTAKISYTPLTPNDTSISLIRSAANLASLISYSSATPTTYTTTLLNNVLVDDANGNGAISLNAATGAYTVNRTGADALTGNLEHYGYGEYVITLEARNEKGIAEQHIDFLFLPLWMTMQQSDDNGITLTDYIIDGVVHSAQISIYRDSDNQKIASYSLSASDLKKPFYINLTDLNLINGTYSIKITAHSRADGPAIGATLVRKFNYENKNIKIPDTGYFLESIDGSNNDLLVTGIIAFLIIVIIALIYVTRRTLKTCPHTTKQCAVKSVKHAAKNSKKSTLKPVKTIKAPIRTNKKSKK